MNKDDVDLMVDSGLGAITNAEIEDAFGAFVRLLKQPDKSKANHNIKFYMKALRSEMALYIFSKIPLATKLRRWLMIVLYTQLVLYACIIISLVCAIFGWAGIGYLYPVGFAVVSYILNGSVQSYLNIRLASILFYCGYLNENDGVLSTI